MLKKFLCHLFLVLKHKHLVLIHAVQCGILYQGLVHDLSKFSPEEFFESVKFYQGNRSPIGVCRRETGMSRAWLHHKGRNKHHLEYWVDADCSVQPLMPYKYAVECICDKLAATKVYNGKSYDTSLPLSHFRKYGNKVETNPRIIEFIDRVFTDLKAYGEKFILKKAYLRETYNNICLGDK